MKLSTSTIVISCTAFLILSFPKMFSVQAVTDDLIPSADWIVTRMDDRNNATCLPGDCSFREAVSAANASPTDDTITFAAGLTTITLTNEIVVNNAGELSINGRGANVFTIDGGAGTNRILSLNSATATISNVTLTGGNGFTGGAINANGGSLTLDGVHVTGNATPFIGGGGGMYLFNGTHRIINSTISGNTASSGGGILADGQSSLTVVNSTISGNSANDDVGGGIRGINITLRNVTITNNSSIIGGGVYSSGGGTLNFSNTVVAGNVSAFSNGGADIYCSSCLPISAGGNLIGDSPGDSTNTGPVSITYQTTDIRDTNPLVGQLQNNGGTTPTHALLTTSPVIDKGINASAVDPSTGNTLTFDQRGQGFTRIRDGDGDGSGTVDIGSFEFALNAANIEELYSAVNNPQNAGILVDIAPGVYTLSVNDPNGVARPNGGRLDLQENMSLRGVIGDRGAVVIDALNLPISSYDNAPPIVRTGAVRMGRGTNSIEWLTVKNAVNGNTNIGTDLLSTGVVHIRIAHVATSNSQRGIDVRNVGPAMAGRVIEAEIIDNDIFNNKIGLQGEALRIANNSGATAGSITARLIGNRSYNNYLGLILTDNGSDNATISVTSSGDRFFENGLGALVSGGLTAANGNNVSFTATGSAFENNNGINNFDHGGLIILGGENLITEGGTSDNTVNVHLIGCRLGNNQLYDLAAWGARSNPETIGSPGTNNRVKIRLTLTYVPVFSIIQSAPASPNDMNSVMLTREWPFDFDGDGKTDIGIFRPSGAFSEWWINRSSTGVTFALQFGASTHLITPADYTGDGKTDIAFFRPSSGEWYVLRSEDFSFFALPFGANGDVPVPADYDNDGKADFAVFRPSSSTWFISQSSGAPTRIEQFGINGDQPVVSDYDGDGKADIGIFRNNAGVAEWWINRSTAGLLAMQFGAGTDKPVQGDYTGDGKADVAIWRPSTGEWLIVRSEDFSFFGFPFGTTGDVVAPGDYDGDGRFDATVFRPSSSTWFIARSTAGTQIVQFGATGDRPIPNAFVP